MPTPYAPFPHTHWSLVRRAQSADPEAALKALAILLHRYTPALRAYLCNVRRLSSDAADDILQSFITDNVIERRLLQHADQNRGRFRNFLLASLNNYANSIRRKESTHPLASLPSLDVPDLDAPTPDATLEIAWARLLIANVLAAMRDECLHSQRADIWTIFEKRILLPIYHNHPAESYDLLTTELRLASPTQAANLLITAKRMYARLLRIAIAEYEPDEHTIEEELHDLHAILSR